MTTRILTLVLAAAAALTCPIASAHPDVSRTNLEVILRDVGDGPGFGHVKFRQPKDADKIVYLGTWVRGLAPEHSYLLQRAVDTTLDGECTSDAWLTLGEGLEPAAITTDARGTGRAQLFRDLAAIPTGTRFDIHFRVVDAATAEPVLASGCYRFTVSE